MRLAPLGNQVKVIAVNNTAAHHQEQNLRQRMVDTPSLSVILDLREMLKKNRKPRLTAQKRFNLIHAPPTTVAIGWHSES